MTSWNPLSKKSSLASKPLLSQSLASYQEDRELEITYVNLQELEDHCKKLYKEVRRYEECILAMHKLEHKISSDLVNSPVSQEDPEEELGPIVESYQKVVFQMGQNTEDLTDLSHKTVVEPMKKFANEFSAISLALKRRDNALQDCLKAQAKYEKTSKLEKTGANIVKTEQTKRAYEAAKEDFVTQNRHLLLELPQFYEKRVDYFQPCLQSLIRSQMDYYGESTRLFTRLVSANPNSTAAKTDAEYQTEVDDILGDIKALSIVSSS